MSARALPRLGFIGAGWIGLSRLKSVLASGTAEISAIYDAEPAARQRVLAESPTTQECASLEQLLASPLDGVVIATPSALHAEQCRAALDRGLAVFCQKPLARSLAETEAVVSAAERADRLLRVDLCYRQTRALGRVRELARSGEIGDIYAAELVFHNAYGPDKSWARDLSLAGGGCLIDLGTHLLDAAFWITGDAKIERCAANLYSGTRLLELGESTVEDFAQCQLRTTRGMSLSLTCSWGSSFGRDAQIRLSLFGSKGGASFENVDGSFYEFRALRFHSTSRSSLQEPPDDWGGRAILQWVAELGESPRYRPDNDLIDLARALDSLYGRRLERT